MICGWFELIYRPLWAFTRFHFFCRLYQSCVMHRKIKSTNILILNLSCALESQCALKMQDAHSSSSSSSSTVDNTTWLPVHVPGSQSDSDLLTYFTGCKQNTPAPPALFKELRGAAGSHRSGPPYLTSRGPSMCWSPSIIPTQSRVGCTGTIFVET